MNIIGTSTDPVSADASARQQGAVSLTCAAGGEPLAGEMQPTMREIDFSRVNLQYLICARDLAREFPQRAGVLLGAPEDIVALLVELEPAALVAVTEVKAPLLVLRQEAWWWQRLFTALQAGRPDELRAVLEQAGLLVASADPRGTSA